MVEDLIKAAKAERRERSLGGFAVGCLLGLLLFGDIVTVILGGILLGSVVYVGESDEVNKHNKIQNPWGKDK